MSKERLRLKEFRDYIDFLDDSQDMQDHGRFIDTLQSLYEDGWFDWIYLYTKEQTERADMLAHENLEIRKGYQERSKRVQELETYVETGSYINRKLRKQNRSYRKAIEKAMDVLGQPGMTKMTAHMILDEALEGDCIHCNGKGFNGLDYCPQCNLMEVNDDN